MRIFQSIFSIISSPDVNKESYFFPSLRAGGILQILQSDWFRERAVFYDLGHRWQFHCQFFLLFVNEKNRHFQTIFLLKLALLLALARAK